MLNFNFFKLINFIFKSMINFTQHPSQVCMSYQEHASHSLYFSYILWIGFQKAFIHAIIPDLFKTSTTELSDKLNKIIQSSGCNAIIPLILVNDTEIIV